MKAKKITYIFALFFAFLSSVFALDPLGIEKIDDLSYKNGRICLDVKFTKTSYDYRQTRLYIGIYKNGDLIYKYKKEYSYYPNGETKRICFNKKLEPGTYKIKAWHESYYCNSKGFCTWSYVTIQDEKYLNIGENSCNEKILGEWLYSKCVIRGNNYGYSEYKVKKQLKDCSIDYQIIKKKDYDCVIENNDDNKDNNYKPIKIQPLFSIEEHVNEPLYFRVGLYSSEFDRNAGFYKIKLLNYDKNLETDQFLIEVGFKNVDKDGNPTVSPIKKFLNIWLQPKKSACDGSNYFASSFVSARDLAKGVNFMPDLRAPNKPGRYKFYFLISNGCYENNNNYKVYYYKEYDAMVLGENDDSTDDLYHYYDDPNNFDRNEGNYFRNLSNDFKNFIMDNIFNFIKDNIFIVFSLAALLIAVMIRSGLLALVSLILLFIMIMW